MKKLIYLLASVFALLGLTSCGCSGGEEADLVFVNSSDAAIATVVAHFEDRGSGVQNANSSPLERGETFGFEVGVYPVTLVVYADVGQRRELGRVTVHKAPSEGERWYVTALDGPENLAFTVDTRWQAGV